MTRPLQALLAIVLLLPLAVAATSSDADPCAGAFCAGAASVDATWHTGAGQGQLGGGGNHLSEDKFDPHHHSTKMVPSDGIQSRTFTKAVVVQGPDGRRAAYVKTDLYLQQDVLFRRVAELVSGADPTSPYVVDGLDASRIMLGGTHNHSAPHYTSTAWGVWIFADAFDFRAFDHHAQRIARAIKEAADTVRPARVGASVITFDAIQQNILGPATADDGSPAGFPRDHFDPELAVVRIDEVDTGDPIAAIVNFGMHPESIGGNANLISSDFLGVVEREVERHLGRAPAAPDGPVVAWSQGGLGDVEPDRSRANHPTEGREYWRRDFAQAERMSAELADAVRGAWEDVAAGSEGGRRHPDAVDGKLVPFTTDAPVDMVAYRFPGPPTHPTPTVSNCRTDHPGAPILGLPDCARGGEPPGWGATVDRLKDAGVPVPENYGAPSYGGVQESMTIHLQTLRIGDVLLATCPCEPVSDMALNFKTRADAQPGNLHIGHVPSCEVGDEIVCEFPRNAWQEPETGTVEPDAYERMLAQITHDAAGWETDPAHLGGEAEPADPAEIKGNFTHDEMNDGFTVPLMVGTANDYVGYVVTYREHQRGDHYRKALTAFGPRTADYIVTRLVAMSRELRGAESPLGAYDVAGSTFDELIQTGKVKVVGHGSEVFTTAYDTAIPDDGGEPGHVVAQPEPVVERFDAATFTWQGGSNYTDNPTVVIERLVDDGGEPRWEAAASQEGGEVVVSLAYDSWSSQAPLEWLAGEHTYEWTATFEAFDATDPGTYRFAVDGHHRSGRQANPYSVVSEPFTVDVWRGLRVEDLRLEDDGQDVSFAVRGVEATAAPEDTPGPVTLDAQHVRYPFTYPSDIPFIDHRIDVEQGGHRYCFRCSFRPWARTGTVVEAAVTVTRADGRTFTRDARFDADTGRWLVRGVALGPGDTVSVEPGQIVDEYGNINGQAASP